MAEPDISPADSPVEASPEPTSAPAESTAAAPATLGTLRDAFKADADGALLKAGPGRGAARPAPDDEAPPEESAEAGSTEPADASKPGEPSPPSRRGAARAIAERDAEI